MSQYLERPLRIAMIGQKSVPARYGGVETHVDNIATRLAAKGHEVWAFCRSRYTPARNGYIPPDGYRQTDDVHTYKDVRLAYRPSINTKHLDATSHTFFCALESGLRHQFDIVHFHGIGPSAFVPVPRLFGRTVISTMHALDWRQVKWGERAKRLLKNGEATGARKSHGVIAVSKIIQEYMRSEYSVTARHIPNGATIRDQHGRGDIARWGLDGGDYILSVGRIIPDRGLHHLLRAFAQLDNPIKLVIVGSEAPRTEYSEHLLELANDRVIFTGDLFGDVLQDLYANCLFYVLPSEVEGLPITPCEAMAHRRAVLLSGIPENREVGGDAALFFESANVEDLYLRLRYLLEQKGERDRLAAMGFERARAFYNWDVIAEQTETFYYDVLRERGRLGSV